MQKLQMRKFEQPTLQIDTKTTNKYKTNLNIKSKDFTPNTLVPIVFDVMFKTMLANIDRLQYLCRLLSYVLDMSEDDIKENFIFDSNELDKDNIHKKGERVDLVGSIGKVIINVEANMSNKLDRNIEYIERISRRKVLVGSTLSDYDVKTIQINLNDFCYQNDSTVDCFWFKDSKGRTMNSKVLVNICIPLIRKKYYTKGIESLDELERFVCMMSMENKKDAEILAKGDELMCEYVKEAKLVEQEDYFYEKFDFEANDREFFKELGRAEGEAETKKDSALRMYKLGLSFEDIINYLNLNKRDQKTISKYLGIN